MTHRKIPALLVTTALLLVAEIGCSHPLEVDLPSGYSGRVAILCERFAEVSRPVQVAADGMAEHATCPRSRQTLTVVRDGKAVPIVGDPKWSVTGDGILLSVEFNVQ